MENGLVEIILCTVIGICIGIVMTFAYLSQELDTTELKREAFERGYMTKAITKDDKVIYQWK